MACGGCNYGFKVFFEQFNNNNLRIDFLVSHGVLNRQILCQTCGKNCLLRIRGNRLGYYCTRRNAIAGIGRCSFSKSAKKGTFLQGQLTVDQVLTFCVLWCLLPNPRHRTIKTEAQISSKTATDWSNFCREVCVEWVFTNRTQIGGPGTIVEIDESKFGRRKYNRGRMVEGQWVFGGVQRGDTSRFFVQQVDKRDAETLLQIIREWILPGTTIISDCWKAYDCLQNEGFQHLRVNHSVEFVDTANSGALHEENIRRLAGEHMDIHTQHIERKWLSLKYSIPTFGRKKEHFEGYFAEYIFKNNFPRTRIFCEFLKNAALLYPPPM